MMYNYPFFSFPRFGRYANYSFRQPLEPDRPFSSQKRDDLKHNNGTENIYNNLNKKSSPLLEEPHDDVFFEIFGLKLYYDDVLLICLIFFLYQENVDDQYLFMALILLLLS